MSNQHPKTNKHRFLRILFLSSLMIGLWLDRILFPQPVISQPLPPSQLVEQGVERYQVGDFSGAIEQWQTALTSYQTSKNLPNTAIVQENLARAYQEIGQIEKAINYWQEVTATYGKLGNILQVGRSLTEEAQAYTHLGKYRDAIAILCGVSTPPPAPPLGGEGSNFSASSLGGEGSNFSASSHLSCIPGSALDIAYNYQDSQGEAAALGSLGDAYRLKGEYNRAITYLEMSWEIAKKIDNSAYQRSALNSLGNIYSSLALVNYRRATSAVELGDSRKVEPFRKEALNNDSKALEYFQASMALAEEAKDKSGKLRSLLNAIPIYSRTNASKSATGARAEAVSLLETLPDTRDKVYAAIDLAHLLSDKPTAKTECLKPEFAPKAQSLLQKAIAIAENIQDNRAQSFALGEMGHIYECSGNAKIAQDFTQKARWAAEQDLSAKDSLYLWEWQAARLLKAQGEEEKAIKTYEKAIATLETIRGDILIANRDLQFDFRDTVEPIYRQLVALRLEEDPVLAANSPDKRIENINAALSTADSLKLAELQNYFGNDCVLTIVNPEKVDVVGANTPTAVFNSIILKNRTAIIASFPNGQKSVKWIDLDRESLRETIIKFRIGLERYRFDDYELYNFQPAQQIYDWLIRPFASDLEEAEIKTLVFVQDGIFRSVPMAALHDGKQFLIENYAIATTPSISLTDPKVLNRQDLRALAFGLTKSSTIEGYGNYLPLRNVASEISQVTAQLPGSKAFLDEDFTSTRLQEELSAATYPILHIATHGQFGIESKDTFLVTGNNQPLRLDELERIIRSTNQGKQQVKFLAFTACQTAIGDDRAILGLAGIALQAGASSALASLWYVDDTKTAQIVTQFYSGLRDSQMNKAEALRAAQLAVMQKEGNLVHPGYWASFILIGNWL